MTNKIYAKINRKTLKTLPSQDKGVELFESIKYVINEINENPRYNFIMKYYRGLNNTLSKL